MPLLRLCNSGTRCITARRFGMKTIPQGRYAVYTLRGSYSGLQEMYDRIYSHPLPTAFRDATSFEEYLNCEPDTEEKDYVTRIYIPIE